MENIDWSNIGFGYRKTNGNVRCHYKDGAWGAVEVHTDENISIHMAATCLHYGQSAFEGLKAFRGKDGKIRIFRLEANAERLMSSCDGILMPQVSTVLFREMVTKVVELNKEFVPPYESGASLYIRPLLIGTSAQVGVNPSKEYLFVIFVTPVGPYFKKGFAVNDCVIYRHFKVGGNYAAGMKASCQAHSEGYACEIYLDAKEKKYIDECGAANFIGIKGNSYVTPASTSILPSITNNSLMRLAADMGMTVEQRQVPEEELATFDEAGACGTAAVVSPIGRIDDVENGVSYQISKDGKPGPVLTELYTRLRAIQYGDVADPYGWVTVIE